MNVRVTLIVFYPAVSLKSFSVPRCFWLTCEQPTCPPAACEVSAFLISREMKLQLVQICKHSGFEIISPTAIVVKLRVSHPLVPSFPSFSLSLLMNVEAPSVGEQIKLTANMACSLLFTSVAIGSALTSRRAGRALGNRNSF